MHTAQRISPLFANQWGLLVGGRGKTKEQVEKERRILSNITHAPVKPTMSLKKIVTCN